MPNFAISPYKEKNYMHHIARRNILLQGWINFLGGIVFLLPVIQLYYKSKDISLDQIILIANIFTISIWLFELPTSVWSDKYGRKLSLVFSMLFNFLCAICILVSPNFIGFSVAAVFGGLYITFWSGTGQAFLDENLTLLNKKEEFGRVIGKFMFYDQSANFFTPLVSAVILKYYYNGYKLLAILDVIISLAMLIVSLYFTEVLKLEIKNTNFIKVIIENYTTAKSSIIRVFRNSHLRLLLIYRCLSSHMVLLPIIILPKLTESGMPEWKGGVVISIATISMMISTRYAYKLGENHSYNLAWIIATTTQGLLLIVASMLMSSWVLLAAAFIFFNFFEGLSLPSWNHIVIRQTGGKNIATIKSIMFSIFALYITIGRHISAVYETKISLVWIGSLILLTNIIIGKNLLEISDRDPVYDSQAT